MANFTRKGYGQVEANQLSGIKTGQVYASLKLDPEVKVLQNGEFMYYNYAKNMVTSVATDAPAEPYLVYNEVKLYRNELGLKDFAMIKVEGSDNYVTNDPTTAFGGGEVAPEGAPFPPAMSTGVEDLPDYGYRLDGYAPRMVKTNVGDIYTTNMVKTGVEYKDGSDGEPPTHLTPKSNSATKTLQLEEGTGAIEFVVVKVYTMPDGQPGLKIQRIK